MKTRELFFVRFTPMPVGVPFAHSAPMIGTQVHCSIGASIGSPSAPPPAPALAPVTELELEAAPAPVDELLTAAPPAPAAVALKVAPVDSDLEPHAMMDAATTIAEPSP